ncbi:MAG: GNAT family N-acetyltransferase [Desulfobacteraceae bacterium]
MEKRVFIRPLEEEDSQAIQKINQSITNRADTREIEKILEQEIQGQGEDACFVAEIDGKVVGYMISRIIHAGFGLEKSAWIISFGVGPDHMDQGIGKLLAEKVFEKYREVGIKHIYTSVQWDSFDILSYFKSLGFERSNFINIRKTL